MLKRWKFPLHLKFDNVAETEEELENKWVARFHLTHWEYNENETTAKTFPVKII